MALVLILTGSMTFIPDLEHAGEYDRFSRMSFAKHYPAKSGRKLVFGNNWLSFLKKAYIPNVDDYKTINLFLIWIQSKITIFQIWRNTLHFNA